MSDEIPFSAAASDSAKRTEKARPTNTELTHNSPVGEERFKIPEDRIEISYSSEQIHAQEYLSAYKMTLSDTNKAIPPELMHYLESIQMNEQIRQSNQVTPPGGLKGDNYPA